ncbi:MAG: pyruvate ferredoxin oxidoreductase [Prevotella sp.]|nr:pyruvate ferredoxin oxidoreductase [Prevotella sp.]
MDYKYIEQLLERYFEAETTLKEEQILKAFFEQNDEEMPAELRQYRSLFAAMVQEDTLGDDFDERLLQMTEEAPQVKARTISLAERLKPLFRAAAVVAIVLTLSNALNQSMGDNSTWVDENSYALEQMEPSADEPAMAYEQAGDSLLTDSLFKPTGYLE